MLKAEYKYIVYLYIYISCFLLEQHSESFKI